MTKASVEQLVNGLELWSPAPKIPGLWLILTAVVLPLAKSFWLYHQWCSELERVWQNE